MSDPSGFARRVLLCVAGTSPQIVTETLYALAVEPSGSPFVPTEVRVLTTSEGAREVRLSLLAPDRDQFGRLCREYGLGGIRFDESCIEVLCDRDGRPMDDIRSPADNEAAADRITQCVAELTADPSLALHASIAGGRKTMGFYLGYALSIYGRAQDRLSHVLVTEGFESHRDFFYKPKVATTLTLKSGRQMSTEDARIHLAEIPVVPFASGLPQGMLERKLSFAGAVSGLRRSVARVPLRIDPKRRRLVWADRVVELTKQQMVIYQWLAQRRQSGADDGWVPRTKLAAHRDGRHAALHADLRRATARAFGEHSLEVEEIDELIASSQPGSPGGIGGEWIGPHISKINATLAAGVDALAVARIGIVAEGERHRVRYRLALEPDLIEWT